VLDGGRMDSKFSEGKSREILLCRKKMDRTWDYRMQAKVGKNGWGKMVSEGVEVNRG